MKKISFILTFAFTTSTMFSQMQSDSFLIKEKKILCKSIKEIDNVWPKQIWSTMDLIEKLNLPFPPMLYEHYNILPDYWNYIFDEILFDPIFFAGLDGNLPIYDYEFKIKKSLRDIQENIMQNFTITGSENFIGTIVVLSIDVTNNFTNSNIKAWWIKEDDFFDEQRGVMDVRVIGLCPLTEVIDPITNEVVGYTPLCGFKFSDIQQLFK